MRSFGSALVASAVVFSACGGGSGDNKAAGADSTKAPAVAAPAAAPTATGTAAPITGKTIEIKMIGDATGYKFEPANVTINAGDGIKFVVVGGGPHNVAFDATKLPADVRSQLDANFGANKMAELSSTLQSNPGESVTISFGAIKPGTYEFNCTPHLAMNMKGTVTVK